MGGGVICFSLLSLWSCQSNFEANDFFVQQTLLAKNWYNAHAYKGTAQIAKNKRFNLPEWLSDYYQLTPDWDHPTRYIHKDYGTLLSYPIERQAHVVYNPGIKHSQRLVLQLDAQGQVRAGRLVEVLSKNQIDTDHIIQNLYQKQIPGFDGHVFYRKVNQQFLSGGKYQQGNYQGYRRLRLKIPATYLKKAYKNDPCAGQEADDGSGGGALDITPSGGDPCDEDSEGDGEMIMILVRVVTEVVEVLMTFLWWR